MRALISMLLLLCVSNAFAIDLFIRNPEPLVIQGDITLLNKTGPSVTIQHPWVFQDFQITNFSGNEVVLSTMWATARCVSTGVVGMATIYSENFDPSNVNISLDALKGGFVARNVYFSRLPACDDKVYSITVGTFGNQMEGNLNVGGDLGEVTFTTR
jgi:hypothetical protein